MRRVVDWLGRLVLGGVFIYAGVLKILQPQLFAHEIDQYAILPHALINLLAVSLPWVELCAGALLVVGVWVRASALVIGCLSSGFFIAIVSVLMRGLKIKCGCFGPVGTAFVGPRNLVLDGVLLGLAVWLWWRSDESRRVRLTDQNGN